MEIKFPRFLSSVQFFNLLREIETMKIGKEQVLLDLSGVHRIDGNVIPNLLLLGNWLEKKTGYIPVIRMGKSFESGYLKKYLYGIKFYEHSKSVYLFEDPTDQYGGFEGKSMDSLNNTWHTEFPFFDVIQDNSDIQKKETEINRYSNEIKRKVFFETKMFLNDYLRKFEYGDTEDKENGIADIIIQMVSNAIERGFSECYFTLQANYTKKSILIAVSDRGIGMRNSINRQRNGKWSVGNEDKYSFFKRDVNSELEAIIEGVYYRKNSSVYGLYNAISQIIDMFGTVRIHSNDTQVILTNRIKNQFQQETIYRYLKTNEYNRRETVVFPGVHIEAEIPLIREKK